MYYICVLQMKSMTDRKNKIRKSVSLTPMEWSLLRVQFASFDTILDFAEDFNIGRVTIKRILDMGSGREDTIAKVRAKLKENLKSQMAEI